MLHAKLLLTAWEHLKFQFSDAALAAVLCSAEKIAIRGCFKTSVFEQAQVALIYSRLNKSVLL
jgi:hypothetical protein